jgi:transposase
MTINNSAEPIEIICSTHKRKRWTGVEKQQIVNETYQPGVSVSYIARKHGIPPSQLFTWRKHLEVGALTGVDSEEKVVPLSRVKELEKQVKKLERMLGKKTMEVEILKEAITIGREKKLISRKPLLGVDDFE